MKKASRSEALDLHPDAMERFESAIGRIVKAGPKHRTAKPAPKRAAKANTKKPAK